MNISTKKEKFLRNVIGWWERRMVIDRHTAERLKNSIESETLRSKARALAQVFFLLSVVCVVMSVFHIAICGVLRQIIDFIFAAQRKRIAISLVLTFCSYLCAYRLRRKNP
jgi:TRAP-type uncharacterized transport system fused permease subunit